MCSGMQKKVIDNILERLPSLTRRGASTSLDTTQWHDFGAGIGSIGSDIEKRVATTTIEEGKTMNFDMEGASSFLGKLWAA